MGGEYLGADNSGPDEFDELDELVGIAQSSSSMRFAYSPKFYARPRTMQLMADEVDPSDVRCHQQEGGSWVTETMYKGITFITVTANRPVWATKSESSYL